METPDFPEITACSDTPLSATVLGMKKKGGGEHVRPSKPHQIVLFVTELLPLLPA